MPRRRGQTDTNKPSYNNRGHKKPRKEMQGNNTNDVPTHTVRIRNHTERETQTFLENILRQWHNASYEKKLLLAFLALTLIFSGCLIATLWAEEFVAVLDNTFKSNGKESNYLPANIHYAAIQKTETNQQIPARPITPQAKINQRPNKARNDDEAVKAKCQHERFFSQKYKGNIDTLVENLPISFSNKHPLKLSKAEIFRLEKQIKNVLPRTIEPKNLLKILSDKTFKIKLIPQSQFVEMLGARGSSVQTAYDSNDNIVYIACNLGFSDKELTELLKNELHSANIRAINNKRYKDVKNKQGKDIRTKSGKLIRASPNPFYFKPSHSSRIIKYHAQTALQRFQEIFSAMNTRVEQFEKLLGKKEANKNLSAKERVILNNYLAAMHCYKPETIYAKARNAKDAATIIRMADKNNRGQKAFIKRGTYRYYIYDYAHTTGGDTIGKGTLNIDPFSNDITDKSRAFIANYKGLKEIIKSPIYNHDEATITKQENLMTELTEFSSFIAQWPPIVQQTFCPEWCEYFSEYTSTKNYCGYSTQQGLV